VKELRLGNDKLHKELTAMKIAGAAGGALIMVAPTAQADELDTLRAENDKLKKVRAMWCVCARGYAHYAPSRSPTWRRCWLRATDSTRRPLRDLQLQLQQQRRQQWQRKRRRAMARLPSVVAIVMPTLRHRRRRDLMTRAAAAAAAVAGATSAASAMRRLLVARTTRVMTAS
jgi:hypothetical protein